MGLPSEEFLLPLHKFNHAVGPLFAEFRGRFPLNQHTENSLNHSLGRFLTYAYTAAMEEMEKLRPVPLSREQWMVAPPDLKEQHMHWQRNRSYLRKRFAYFQDLLGHKNGKHEEDDDAY
jgi:hypothetical protein